MSYEEWRGRLSQANDPAFWPITAIDEELASGRAQFWGGEACAMVTRIIAYPGGAVTLDVLAAAGNLEELTKQIAPAAEEWARAQGLTHIVVSGRPGWARVLKNWRHFQNVMVKELA